MNQINNLKVDFPETHLNKQLPDRDEYRVPIKIKVSTQPLWLQLILGNGFPMYIGPMIQVLSRVQHKSIENGTNLYKGPALRTWDQNSSLVKIIKAIEIEFNQEPPVPVKLTSAEQNVRNEMQQQNLNAAQGKQEYQPPVQTITRPNLIDFKKRVDTQLSKDELNKLVADDQEWLRMMVSQEPEIDAIQKCLNQNLQEIEDLAKSNKDKKEELMKLVRNYDEKKEQYVQLRQRNEELEAEITEKSISKKQIVDLLNKKIKDQELKTKEIEKKFYKDNQINMKEFVKSYMAERKHYHRHQIFKMKVNAN